MHSKSQPRGERISTETLTQSSSFGNSLRVHALLALGLVTSAGCSLSNEPVPQTEREAIPATAFPEPGGIQQPAAQSEPVLDPGHWSPSVSDRFSEQSALYGIQRTYHHYEAQEGLERVFEASVLMHELSDHFAYGHGTLWERPAEQSEDDYESQTRRYFASLVEQDMQVAQQAEVLATESMRELSRTLPAQASTAGRVYQYILQNPEYRKSFAETAAKHGIDPDTLLLEINRITEIITEAEIPRVPVTEETLPSIQEKLDRYRRYSSGRIPYVGSNLYGFTMDQQQKKINTEAAYKLISQDIPGLLQDPLDSRMSYWSANLAAQMHQQMEWNPVYRMSLRELATARAMPAEQLIQAAAGIIALQISHGVGLDTFDQPDDYWDSRALSRSQETLAATYGPAQLERFNADLGAVLKAADISEEEFERLFGSPDLKVVSSAFGDGSIFNASLEHHARCISALNSVRRSEARVRSRGLEMEAVTGEEVDTLAQKLAAGKDSALLLAKSRYQIAQLVWGELHSTKISFEIDIEQIEHRSEAESTAQLRRNRLSDRFEATMALQAIGFSVELLRTSAERIGEHRPNADSEDARRQIDEWSARAQQWNDMLHSEHQTAGGNGEEGPQTVPALLVTIEEYARCMGLESFEIDQALQQGRDLANSLDPEKIGRYHPLSFRASGGSGVLYPP